MARLEGFEPTTPGSEGRQGLCWGVLLATKWCFVVGGEVLFCIWDGARCFGVATNLLAKC